MECSRKRKRDLKVRFGDVTKDNIGQLRRLNLAIFPVTYNDKFYRDVLSNESKEILRLVFHSDVLVGAVCCRIEAKPDAEVEDDVSKKANKKQKKVEMKRVYIMTLGVLAPYRGYGIGRKMIEKMIDFVKTRDDVDEIFLNVQTSNEDAINFYKHFGFEIKSTIRNYYKRIEPPDCYVVSRHFDKSSKKESNAQKADTVVTEVKENKDAKVPEAKN